MNANAEESNRTLSPVDPAPGAESGLPGEHEPPQSRRTKCLGVVGATSRRAGVAVGTVAAVGGKVVGAGARGVASIGKGVRASAGLFRLRPMRDKIRSVVIEELTRWMGGDAELARSGLGDRLQAMAETLIALQKRVGELSARGRLRSADLTREIAMLEAAAPLTNDERAVLVSVFRQNIALQKPELTDGPVPASMSSESSGTPGTTLHPSEGVPG